MAAVRIDTGPVSATDYVKHVPREKWWNLIAERRSFCRVDLPSDCRELLRWVEEAERFRMWEHEKLKAANLEEFIRKHLDLDPDLVRWALAGLKVMKPQEAVPFERAVEIGRLRAGPGRPTNDEKNVDNYQHLSARDMGGGTSRAYTLARLRRDDPETAAAVERKELSANAAAVAKGWRKPPDAYKQLVRWWKAADAEQKNAFEEYIANMRRQE